MLENAVENEEIIQLRFGNASDEEKENLYMALNVHYDITDVLPPPNHDDVQVIVMAVGYMLLFILGTCGNVAVLTTIRQVTVQRRVSLDNTLIYVVVLSIVDFGVCLSLPFTVIDQILGFWMFGTVVCKVHAVLENVGKILSALIIMAMSFDRYAGVCLSQKKFLRSSKFAYAVLGGLIIYALTTMYPLLNSFTARELILFERETGPQKITRMRIEKCTMVNVSTNMFTIFTLLLFLLCYIVPLFSVLFFYSRLLLELRRHARQFASTQIPIHRITFYTAIVAGFYFVCWTPFWSATVYAVYLEYRIDQTQNVPAYFVYIMYFIHALPFTNSAVNWILYGSLNSQLQNRHSRNGGRVNENTTIMANGNYSQCPTIKTNPSINGISSHNKSDSNYNHNSLHGCLYSVFNNNTNNNSSSINSGDTSSYVQMSLLNESKHSNNNCSSTLNTTTNNNTTTTTSTINNNQNNNNNNTNLLTPTTTTTQAFLSKFSPLKSSSQPQQKFMSKILPQKLAETNETKLNLPLETSNGKFLKTNNQKEEEIPKTTKIPNKLKYRNRNSRNDDDFTTTTTTTIISDEDDDEIDFNDDDIKKVNFEHHHKIGNNSNEMNLLLLGNDQDATYL